MPTEGRYYWTITVWAVVCILIGVILYFLTRPGPPEPAPIPTSTVTVTASPAPQGDPESVVMIRKYYALIDGNRFEEAYRMRSRQSWSETSFQKFVNTWANNESIEVQDVQVLQEDGDRAVLRVRLLAQDQGHSPQMWENTVRLIREDGQWRYAGADVKAVPR